MAQLIGLLKSKRKNKLYDAVFDVGKSKPRVISFGSSQHSNYTVHHDKERRRLYRLRHHKDNLDTPFSPGALSWYILWGESTSLGKNVKEFRRRFDV